MHCKPGRAGWFNGRSRDDPARGRPLYYSTPRAELLPANITLSKSRARIAETLRLIAKVVLSGSHSVVRLVAVFNHKASFQPGDLTRQTGRFDAAKHFLEILVCRRRLVLRILPAVGEDVVLVE